MRALTMWSHHPIRLSLVDALLCIWSLDHVHRGLEPGVQRLVPSSCAEIVFYLGDRAAHREGGDGARVVHARGDVSGQKTSFIDIETTGHVDILGVMLRPNATAQLLGRSAREIANLHVDAEELWGQGARDLVEALGDARDPSKRVEILETFLEARLRDAPRPGDRRIRHCVDLITARGGTGRVSQLAEEACLSTRQLERRFLDEVGLSPKAFARTVRFQYVLSLEQHRRASSLTDLAYQAGYADQAHFIRDWRALTGQTPREYFQACAPLSDYYLCYS